MSESKGIKKSDILTFWCKFNIKQRIDRFVIFKVVFALWWKYL